jgi:Cu/Ag efflux protein CusF
MKEEVMHALVRFPVGALAAIAVTAALLGTAPVVAQPAGTLVAQLTPTELTDGEVRKVDKDAGKLTLKHADIKSLDMPAMTMVFVVKDKAMLDKLQPGDKVKFRAVSDGGKFTVTDLQVVR